MAAKTLMQAYTPVSANFGAFPDEIFRSELSASRPERSLPSLHCRPSRDVKKSTVSDSAPGQKNTKKTVKFNKSANRKV